MSTSDPYQKREPAYIERALESLTNAHYDEAIGVLQAGLRLDPEHMMAHHYLRSALQKKSELDHYREAYGNGKLEKAFFSSITSLHGKDYKKAGELLTNLLTDNPENARVLNTMGKVKLETNELDEALHCFEKAYSLDPSLDGALLNKAHAYAQMDYFKSAAHEDLRQLASRTRQKSTSRFPLPKGLEQQGFSKDEEDGLPIVIFHRDFNLSYAGHDYLYYCFFQAKKSNPRSPIYLITDSLYQCDFIHHENMLDYFDAAIRFSESYIHVTKEVLYSFLTISFHRWFALNEFMEKRNINRCFHIDPDILLYVNVTEELKYLENYDILVSDDADFGTCGHTIFVNNREVLCQFCDYITFLFSKPDSKAGCTPVQNKIWHTREGYLSDIEALQEFVRQSDFKYFNLAAIHAGSYYDPNIATVSSFESQYGFKKVQWHKGLPYVRHKEMGELVRFKTLHFNSNTKMMMMQAFYQKPFLEALPKEIREVYT